MDIKIDEYLAYIRNIRNYSEHTKTNYLVDLEEYELYLKEYKKDYKKMTHKEILDYVNYLKCDKNYKMTSINRHLSSIRSFYDFLIFDGTIKNNPFKLVNSLKQEKKLPNFMKYDELNEMISACGDDALGIRNRLLLELLFATGARVSELVNIKIKDIDFNKMEIKVLGKGSKERICYFTEYTKEALDEYLDKSRDVLLKGKETDFLFVNNVGTPLTQRGVRDIIDRTIKKSALNTKITPHTFRHTFATILLNEGCDLKSVQELLGHESLSTTSIYTHLTNDRIKSVYFHTHPRNK